MKQDNDWTPLYRRDARWWAETLLWLGLFVGSGALMGWPLLLGLKQLPEGLAFARAHGWTPALFAAPIALILVPFLGFIAYSFLRVSLDGLLDALSDKTIHVSGAIEEKQKIQGHRGVVLYRVKLNGEYIDIPFKAYQPLKVGQEARIDMTPRIKKVVAVAVR